MGFFFICRSCDTYIKGFEVILKIEIHKKRVVFALKKFYNSSDRIFYFLNGFQGKSKKQGAVDTFLARE